MARYSGPSCRICRREGIKLFLKGARCTSAKCAFAKREYSPGQHGNSKTRTKLSDYGLQLREKQKVKKMYGIMEKQFRRYFSIAARAKGVTGQMLLELLERRVDNVIFRMGFAVSRAQARQIVRHRHVVVNGKVVNIPSFSVKINDAISVRGKDAFIKLVKETIETTKERGIPGWIEVNANNLSGKILRNPTRDDVGFPIQEQLIVELYSK